MNRIFSATLALVFLSAWAGAAAAPYTMADLEALQKRGQWAELIAHLQDIPPSARQGAWNRLAVQACVDGQYPQYLTLNDITYPLNERCNEMLESVVTAEPANADQAWTIAKWARVNRAPWYAVRFFDQAIAKPGDARCKDEDVALAVNAALALPAGSNTRAVEQAQSLAFGRCWEALRGSIEKAFSQESGYYLDNSCPSLKKKKALPKGREDKCKPSAT